MHAYCGHHPSLPSFVQININKSGSITKVPAFDFQSFEPSLVFVMLRKNCIAEFQMIFRGYGYSVNIFTLMNNSVSITVYKYPSAIQGIQSKVKDND